MEVSQPCLVFVPYFAYVLDEDAAMRLHPVLLTTAALALLSCGSAKDSYVVIHSDVSCDVPRVFQLRVTIYNDGTADQKYIPETPSAELGFPSTISLVLSGSRSGAVDLVVEALSNNRQTIGQGTVSGTLVSGGRIDLSVQLVASLVTGTSPSVEPGIDGGALADSGGGTKLDALAVGGAPFALVSAGGHHTCATRSDTSLWCWGNNTYGQLRLSGTSNRLIPTEVSATSWATVACGQTDACGIRTDGTMSCWGNNGSNQLGASTTAAEPRIEVAGGPWQAISPGSYQSCGIQTDGTLWCWGDNTNGQLGTGNTVATSAPTQVTGTGWGQVSTSYYHTCATKQDGTLWCWGLNANLQLADSSVSSRMSPGQVSGSDWTQVVTGEYHTCATKSDKSLWCWGGNTAGQLGNASTPILATGSQGGVSIPLQVTGAWDSISAGLAHTCGIMSDQSLWCWGDNSNGQLGNGSQISSSTPVAIAVPGKAWASVSVGSAHTCALGTDSTLWCWGDNSDGQLGTGSGGVQPLPTRVMQ
jgi:alpha-tubulin suppressor-like RCC1 family protein